MNPAAILAFAGIDDLAADAPPRIPVSYATLVGPRPNPFVYPGNPPYAQRAGAPAVYKTVWTHPGMIMQGGRPVPRPERSAAAGLGEITAGDILGSGFTLMALIGLTAVAGLVYWQVTKNEEPISGGPRIDWDQLGSEWDEAARR